ncbi:ATP-binding protein [uncultured Parabacteroides sp.]|uniref:ATP-binding protein n=2 Tax=uncultured Parabacteroides sp. TaxID=512312 RepID=UPI0025F6AA45|nr:ATP-binding protein [uncultured Parabacteroides sp.]
MIRSEINPILTLDYLTSQDENKHFDRKSAKIKVADIADLISAFANAEGGTIAIGISDKTKTIEGINSCGIEKINNFLNAPKDCCKPMPVYDDEFLDVINNKGEQDRILFLHIHASIDQIIRTVNDSTYLRIGDKTKELKGVDLRNLEYSKSTRHYEDECNMDASLSDLDNDSIMEYKRYIKASHLSTEQVLRARGFLKKQGGREYLTNAAVLLFAQNVQQFYPNCRVRFVRYEGNSAQVGTNINIIRDVNIECSIVKIIDEAKRFIGSQLREFTALDQRTGKFQIVPEYPEFAWLEGIVNAVTHREYGMSGSYIKVTMYDDRLEILSPGRLPNIVTVSNIQVTRYSRNPRIARVLTDFGWVRELNEGVKRIYSDMKELFLDEPIYTEPEQSVKLVLKNNIVMRTMRQSARAEANVSTDIWNSLDDLERAILTYMGSKAKVTRLELEAYTGKARRTVLLRLNRLIEYGLVRRYGRKNDPVQYYEMVLQ